MDKLVDELLAFPNTFKKFQQYLITIKLDPNVFCKAAPNTATIPLLINFLEKEYKIDMLDAIFYTHFHRPNSYNQLIKTTIKVCFHKIEKEQSLDFLVF